MPISNLRIVRREAAFGGRSFKPGPYEVLFCLAEGTASFASNSRDASRTFKVDVFILRPVSKVSNNESRGNSSGSSPNVLFYEVNNRGTPLVFATHCSAPRIASYADFLDAKSAGNGFLCDLGLTMVWSGWIGTIPCWGGSTLAGDTTSNNSFPTLLGAEFPTLKMEGRFTDEAVFDPPYLDAGVVPLTYRPKMSNPELRVVLRTTLSDASDVVVPPEMYSLSSAGNALVVKINPGKTFSVGGQTFQPSQYLVRVTYTAIDPPAMDLGFDATREVVSYLKTRVLSPSLSNISKPLTAVAYGYSQSGRFIKSLLYERGNLDPSNRSSKLFDLVLPHVSGARLLSLSQPFPFPGRFPRDFEDHDFVTPNHGRPHSYFPTDGSPAILDKCIQENSQPIVVHVDSSNEFWQGWSSLVQSFDTLNCKDSNLRLFLLSSVQHMADPSFIPSLKAPPMLHLNNRADYRPAMRAILKRALDWLMTGKEMGPSAWPRLDKGELIAPDQLQAYLTSLPATSTSHLPEFPKHANAPHPSVSVLVPKPISPYLHDTDVQLVCQGVPLGTYVGWNQRPLSGAKALGSALGAWFPLSREQINKLYPGGKGEYLDKSKEWLKMAVERGWILEGDVERALKGQGREWDAVVESGFLAGLAGKAKL